MRTGVIVRHAFLALSIFFAVQTAVAAEPGQRTLTFEDRVYAQAAIERIYYSHQIGATKSFEQAVPRAVLESKVRKYLDQTAALNVYWKTAVTDEMLQRELERMATGTRMPERLLELYAALDNDSFIVKECLARATLVDRLAHNFYAFDPTRHADARRRAEELHRQLSSGELSPTTDHPNRSVIELVMSEAASENSKAPMKVDVSGTTPFRRELSPGEFRKQRSQFPSALGHVSTLKEEPDGFLLAVVLSETPREVRMANYVIPKTSWDDWWTASKHGLRVEATATAVTTRDFLPVPTKDPSISTAIASLNPNGSSCAANNTWDNGALGAMPDARSGHTAVWTGTLMLVWGGADRYDYYPTAGGRYDPATDTWTPMSIVNAPSGRSGHTAVWSGGLMLVWGGAGSTAYPNTDGRYDPTTDTWTPISPTGAPSERVSHTAVWTGSVMVVWGGYANSGQTITGTGGRYDPTTDTWTPMSPTGAPSERGSHTAVWTGSVMVVWGGYTIAGGTNTGGRYDPTTDSWTPTSMKGAPSARTQYTAVWTGSLMVIWGGNIGYGPAYDTGGRYDPTTDTWTPISTTNAPPARKDYSAVWTGNLMIVWGGYYVPERSHGHRVLLDSGGGYDPSTDSWTPMSTTGSPSRRFDHSAVWTGELMVVWGGDGNGENDPRFFVNTGGRYDPETDSWTPTATAPAGTPSARAGHTAVWTGSLMVVWGAGGDAGGLSTGGRYDPATDSWAPTSTVGAPSTRWGHAAVWTGSRMVVWGGGDYVRFPVDTGGRYDPTTDSWTPTSTTRAPSARSGYTAVSTGRLMVVWGGYDWYFDGFYHCLTTGWRYDPATDSWTPTSTEGAPSARSAHSAVWTGSEMVVWGGSDESYYGKKLDTGGRYDPATDRWTPTTTADAPSPRSSASVVWTGNLVVVWGGRDGDFLFDTGGRYDPATDTWMPTSMTGAPYARSGYTAVSTGSRMVVWGGYDDTGSRYDPASDSWTATSTTGAPSARDSHTAVWTGSLMVVWGGSGDNGNLQTGGRYVLLGAAEICNGIDDDCDGIDDNGGNALCDDNDVCTEDRCQAAAGCANRLLDFDRDGVCDLTDQCPGTVLTPTVVIGNCDSGVRNHTYPDGCNFGDRIAACRANARNHGQFVSCVAHLVNDWARVALIARREGSRIMQCAARK